MRVERGVVKCSTGWVVGGWIEQNRKKKRENSVVIARGSEVEGGGEGYRGDKW